MVTLPTLLLLLLLPTLRRMRHEDCAFKPGWATQGDPILKKNLQT